MTAPKRLRGNYLRGFFARVRAPVPSGDAKRVCRQTSQDVCPYNIKFSRALAEDSPYAPREALGGRDARTLARELLGMTQAEFSAAFKGSPMKRAKLRGLKRNAAVVLGNAGTVDDVPVLEQALTDPDPLVRQHAVLGLRRLEGERDALRRPPAHAGTSDPQHAPDVRC
jgi:epoxyqueuosine reductase